MVTDTNIKELEFSFHVPTRPLITTIIPTYRRPLQLRQAIISVLEQTYRNFQVCVYDNASGDDTALVVSELAKTDPRVKYYCHNKNIGALKNFEFGLKHVETPYFSFLSDDDIVLPDFYETALAGFKSHPNAVFSATEVIYLGRHGNITKMPLERWSPGPYDPPAGLIAILENGHSAWTGILFNKVVVERVGSLDQGAGVYSDLDFTLRAAAQCSFVVSKRPCAIFCESISQAREPYPFNLVWSGLMKMIQNIKNIENLTLDIKTYAAFILLQQFESKSFELGVSYLSRGRPIEAKKVAVLLRDQFGGRARYIALSIIIYMHQCIPFARPAFDFFIDWRRYIRFKQMQNKQKRYKEISILENYRCIGEMIEIVRK
jgi:glycosyltransferase involved in cell wall biosynthesis